MTIKNSFLIPVIIILNSRIIANYPIVYSGFVLLKRYGINEIEVRCKGKKFYLISLQCLSKELHKAAIGPLLPHNT